MRAVDHFLCGLAFAIRGAMHLLKWAAWCWIAFLIFVIAKAQYERGWPSLEGVAIGVGIVVSIVLLAALVVWAYGYECKRRNETSERASPQENKARAASSGAGFKAADSGAGCKASDSLSRGLPNNPAGDASIPQKGEGAK